MKTIIAGGRYITDYQLVIDAVRLSGFVITEVVSGGASGVDALGEKWAIEHSVPVKKFPANWEKFGKKAGPLRNEQMADCADALIAVWDGLSRGTLNMIENADRRGLKVYVYEVKQ